MSDVQSAFDSYRDAVYAKDVDAFVGLYDPAVQVFDMWGVWSYDGRDAWRGMATEWFGSLGDERVGVEFTHVRSEIAGDLAFAHALVTYTGLSAEGKALRAMTNRISWVLRRSGGAWRVVHEHSSAPVDFETQKAILQAP